MSRTILSPKRLLESKATNIGRIIIFCEGETEQFYFEYFSNIIKKNKYTDVKVVVENAAGNARRVLKYANSFMSQDDNIKKFSNYDKYLVFDCDAPRDIQPVVLEASNHEEYNLLVSNYLFEVWLLMHFEDVGTKLSRKKIYEHLSNYLHSEYVKADRGIIREIIQNGNVEQAIVNAKDSEDKYLGNGYKISSNIKEMNPYSNVYKLIEEFMVEISQ